MRIFGYNISKEQRSEGQQPSSEQSYTPTTIPFATLLNRRSAMSISTVYRCVEIISDSIACLPIQVKDADQQIVANHPIITALDGRGSIMSKYQLVKMLVQSVLLRGNGYAYIERATNGIVKSLRFVEAGDVSIMYDKAKQTLFYSVPTISPKRIEPCNMLHFLHYSNDGVSGLSVISAANKSITLASNTDEAASQLYSKGLKLDGVLKGGTNADQRTDMKKTFLSSIESGVAVLPPNVEYQSISLTAKDAEIIESRQFNAKDIARFFGVSPSMLGDLSGGYYGSIESEQTAFILHTLPPYVTMIEQELERKLLMTAEKDYHINLDETFLMKSDKAATATFYSTLVTNGILTRNEARVALGYGEVDGGDALTVSFTDINQNTINNQDNGKE